MADVVDHPHRGRAPVRQPISRGVGVQTLINELSAIRDRHPDAEVVIYDPDLGLHRAPTVHVHDYGDGQIELI